MSDENLKVLGALAAGVASLAVAVLGYFFTKRNQRALQAQVARSQKELEKLQNKNRASLEEIKDQLDQRKSERDALRDYEYEARKRLYVECGPLLFQLLELSEGAMHRIRSLARSAREGKLAPPDNWLNRPYYRASTLYKLTAPLATLKLIQQRLTLVDLSLDRHIFLQYAIAKQIYLSFGDDFYFAKAKLPPLPYDPHNADAETKRETEPREFWQQGIPIGILDNAIEALIATDAEGVRLKSFGEFERYYIGVPQSDLARAFKRIDYLVTDFQPRDRPVLWRLLVTQAHMYGALLRTGDRESTDAKRWPELLEVIPKASRAEYDWRRPTGPRAADETVLSDPFECAKKYLTEKLGPQFVEKNGQREQ